MPELPEVETIRTSLSPAVVGRSIVDVDVRESRLRRPLSAQFPDSLIGRVVTAARRRAKYLLFDLNDGMTWITHFGMSGRLVYHSNTSVQPGTHDHVIVGLDGGGRLVFNDPRRFGLMTVEDEAASQLFRQLGPEPLDESCFTADHLAKLRAKTVRTVKDVLMDQRVVGGLGNIYVNELLFLAGIRPTRRLKRMTRDDCERVVSSARSVLADAIEHKGSSISDFLDGIGRRGAYQGRLRVYDRQGKPCSRCGAAIKSVVVGQRSSFYCPRCQR